MPGGKTEPKLNRTLAYASAAHLAVRVRALRTLVLLEKPADAASMIKTFALTDPSPWVADVCNLLLDDLKRRNPEIRIPPRWFRFLTSIWRARLIEPLFILIAAIVTFVFIGWLISRFDPRVFSVLLAIALFSIYYVAALFFVMPVLCEWQIWRAWRGLKIARLKVTIHFLFAAAIATAGLLFLGPLPYLAATGAIAVSLWIARQFILVPAFKGRVVSKTLWQMFAPSMFALIYVGVGMMPFQEMPFQSYFPGRSVLFSLLGFYVFIALSRFGIYRMGAVQGGAQRLLIVAQHTCKSNIGLIDAVVDDLKCRAIHVLAALQHSQEIDKALLRIIWDVPSGFVQAEAIKALESLRIKAGKDPHEGLKFIPARGPGKAPFYKNVNGRLVGGSIALVALISTCNLFWNLYQSHNTPDAAKAFLLYRLGDEKAALERYERHLQSGERNAETLNTVAMLYATARDTAARNPNRAVEYAQEAVELDGWKKANYIDTLAEAYLATGQTREAQHTFERALESSSGIHSLYLRYRIEQIKQNTQ
jgi:tetratricopeptide (TPR) repeat protein